jgi:hypothetical protein
MTVFFATPVMRTVARGNPYLTGLGKSSPLLAPQSKKWPSAFPRNVETASHYRSTHIVKFRVGQIRIRPTGVSADQGGPRFRLR